MVTDAKVMRSKCVSACFSDMDLCRRGILCTCWPLKNVQFCRDGRSRLFGFVGFRTTEQAEDAVRYFNRTFMDTSRLTVEVNEACVALKPLRLLAKAAKASC